jgi:hypothetical protein
MSAKPIPVLAAVLALAACDQAAAPTPKPAPAAKASALRNAPEFASCRWETVKGARFSIDSFACGPQFGRLHLEADDDLPGFRLVSDGEDGAVKTVAIRFFDKAPEAPIEAVLPAVRQASGPKAAACGFLPAEGVDHQGKARVVLSPLGEAKAAWDRSVAGDEPEDLPCGPLGVGIAGDRFLFEVPGHGEVVAYADMGSEIQIFDPETLRPSTP